MEIKINNSYIKFMEDTMEENTVEIDMVYVDKAERGKKLGYKLLAEAEKWAKENGYTRLSLCAYPQEDDGMISEDLIEYYKGYGFCSYEGTEIMYMDIF